MLKPTNLSNLSGIMPFIALYERSILTRPVRLKSQSKAEEENLLTERSRMERDFEEEEEELRKIRASRILHPRRDKFSERRKVKNWLNPIGPVRV